MTDKILRRREVEEVSGLSRSTIYRLIEKGMFPRPALIGQRAVGWRQSTIDVWIADWLTATKSVSGNSLPGSKK